VVAQVDGETGARVAETVLRALPQWFGLEQPILDYIEAARRLPTFVATADETDVGFLTIEPQTPVASEVLAMGVLPEWHRRGIGRSLIDTAIDFSTRRGHRLLQVKTLGPSHPDDEYARTRAFYEALGFLPLEETTAYWGPENPCLVLVLPLPHP
jgi:GNAT superfamily N-acetyltransferase